MEKSSQFVPNTEAVIIGKIGKAHGIKGEMRLFPLTDFPERLSKLKKAYLNDKAVTISALRTSNNFFIIKVAGIDSRETAEKYNGAFLTIDRDSLSPLKAGEYYYFDIIDLNVYEGNTLVGKIKDIFKTGSNDVYVIKELDGNELLLPAIKRYVEKIDIENGRINIIRPEII